tara:strand:- start:1110 stop:1652 length:543 start_codon:yes stop_codon:yes gene_type:complete
MNGNTYLMSMFYVPLLHIVIDGWKKKKSNLLKIIEKRKFSYGYRERIKSDFYKENQQSYAKKIQDILSYEIKNAGTHFGFENLNVINAWFEKAERNMYHQIHNHGAYGVSAVCFIEYDSQIHTPTQFVAPFNNYINGQSLQYSPNDVKEGSILFFPSLIHHYTIPNDSDKERVTLSFNLY